SQQIIDGRDRREAIERQTRVRAELVAKINGLAPRVTSFSNDTPAMIGRFAPINERYKSVTEWMMAAHGRQGAIYGNGQASVVRGQIGVSIHDAAGQANQLHVHLESSYQEVLGKVRALGRDLSEAVGACEAPTNASLLDSSDVQAACLKLPNFMKSFQQ